MGIRPTLHISRQQKQSEAALLWVGWM